MTNQILLIFLNIIIYESYKFFKFNYISNFNLIKKIFKLIKLKKNFYSKKEKLILIYSKKLFIYNLRLISFVIYILIILLLLNLISESFLKFIISIFGLIESSIFIIIWSNFRKS